MLAQALNFSTIQSQANIGLPGSVGELITKVLPYVVGIAGMLLLVYLVLGGLQMMLSRGDPKAVAAAQAKITNAIIGIVVILLSAGIVVLLGQVFKINVFTGLFTK